MQTSMMKPIGYLLLRWRSLVALLGGILAAIVMLVFALSGQSDAQTTVVVPRQHYIAAGDHHSLAVKGSDGTVYAWGNNEHGQLGIGNNDDHTVPYQVVGHKELGTIVGHLTGINYVAAGETHTLAIHTNGTIDSWGSNDIGQLGTGLIPGEGERSYPKTVSGLCGASVAAGDDHSLALGCDGRVWSWGSNQKGQLGIGSQYDVGSWSYTPVQVKGPQGSSEQFLTGAKAIAVGDNHNLAVKSDDGSVYAWGENSNGQLGIGNHDDHTIPYQVLGGRQGTEHLTGVLDVAAGHYHSLAIVSDGTADNVPNDGTVYAWGENAKGQLGIGNNDDHTIPYQVLGGRQGLDPVSGKDVIHDIVGVAAGENHSLAVDKDGHVYAWGGGWNGQLGINSNNDHTIPYQVHGPNNGQPPTYGLSGITDVAAGKYFSLALRNDSTVWAWGGGTYGQQGVHSNNDQFYPVQVHGVGNVDYLTGIGQPSASSPPGGYPPDEHPPDVAICHKRDKPAEKTFYVPSSKAERLLNKKDYTPGACEE